MALTKEDAVMISQLFGEQLEKQLEKHLAPIHEQLQGIHMRLDRLEERVAKLEERMTALEERVTKLEERMTAMEGRMTVMEGRMTAVEDRMTINEGHMLKVELLLENDMLPRLQNIEACYTSTYRRYQFRTEQIDTMQEDVNVLKKVVQEHSEMLLRLA